MAGLLPANYTVTVEVPGFKKLEEQNVALDAQDHLARGFRGFSLGAGFHGRNRHI
jgi:hypothetical protein